MTPPDQAADAALVAEMLGAGWSCTTSRRPFCWAETVFLAPPGTGEQAQRLDADSPAWRALVILARSFSLWREGHAEYRARVREHAAKAVRAIGDLAR